MFERKEEVNIKMEEKMQKKYLILAAKILATVLVSGLFVFLLCNKEFYYKGEQLEVSHILWPLVFSILSLVMIWMKNFLGNRGNTIALLVTALLGGVINFWGMELVSGDLTKLRHLIGLLNLVIIYFVMMTVFAICNRIKPAVVVTTLVMYLFAISNYFTNLFRGIPILASDLALIKTATVVAGDFEYKVNYHVVFYTMMIVCLFILLARLEEKEKLPVKYRVGYLGGYAVVLVAFLYVVLFSNTLQRLKINVQPFDPNRSYNSNGSVLTFIRSCQMVSLKAPEGYNIESLEAFAKTYQEEYEQDNKTYRTPNVIVVMNEAFSDLQEVESFETNVDVTPVIHSLSENTIKGTAYSSVYGGKTSNSEYEFLTGHPTVFLNDVVPFQFLIKKPMANLTSILRKNDYQGMLAIHPHFRRGYNREIAYDNLGFERFLAIEDMPSDREIVRNHMSDKEHVNQLIAHYEALRAESDAPVYLYSVTMQNHSPWDEPFDNFTPDVKVTDERLLANEDVNLFQIEQYLSLVKLSDASLGILIDYFSQVEEDTVIVFFGDHQPKLGGAYYSTLFGKKTSEFTQEENMQKYEVPYVIWTNYDIEEKEYGDISLNYLSTVMMDGADMKLPPYNRFLLDMMEEVPVLTVNGYWDKNHVFYGEVNDKSPYKEMLNMYQQTQYNNLIDSNHRIENFFD